ncbi:MAG: hypothetical protein K2N32_02800 [Clostridia bacterium]|nr:hypothetical protein [Clostridia bacterium]
MVSQEDIDNFDMEEDKVETSFMKKRHKDARGLAHVGFIIALSALVLVVVLSFIDYCLIWSRSIEYVRFSKIYVPLMRIGRIVGLAGMIVSIIAYVRSAKNDADARKYSAVGITIGAMLTWTMLLNLINMLVQQRL